MSIINAYGDSTITVWEVDDNGEKISVPILNEKKQVIGNKIVLEGLPDEQYRVFIDGFVEIDIKDEITEVNQFKVDYRKYGTVFFHPDLDGQWITINRYYSKGLIYIPSSRIWVKINEFGEVIETLDSVVAKIETISGVITDLDNVLVNANTTKIDLDNTISTGNTTKSNLDASIDNANTINDTLSNPTVGIIKKATDIDNQLSNTVSTAESTNSTLSQTNTQARTTKGELDKSISVGNTLKTNLDTNISTGTTLKNNLDANITEGNTLKTDLSPVINDANISKVNLDNSISAATTKTNELDGSISSATTKKTELDTSVSNANTINDTLSNPTTGTIKKATDINTTLNSSIDAANVSKDTLDTSISNASSSKSNLDNSVSTANTTKIGLDNSITEGNTLKGDLNTIIEGTDFEQVITDVNSLKKDQHNHINKTTLDGLSDIDGKLKYNGQDIGIGDMKKNVYDIDNDGKVDMANNSDKLGGQLPSYYAKTTDIPDISGKTDKIYVDTELDKKIDKTKKGVANGLAELDSGGKVPSSQLPSYVDDVLEFSSKPAFPATGETGKIYVATDTNLTYRWSGTEYIEISPSIALGETSSTAYRGDRGKVAYDHSQLVHDKHLVGLGNVDNTSDLDKPISTAMLEALNNKVNNARVLTDVPVNAKFTDTVTTINGKAGAISKEDIVALGIPSQDTNTTYSEISTAEIDAGTASTLRTITGRRIGYIFSKISDLISNAISALTKSNVGLSNVDNVKQMPISGGVLQNYREKLVTLSGTTPAINLNNGNVFTHTLSSTTTYSISNAVSGQAHSFTLIITQTGTVRTITFPASVKWQGGEIPDLSTASKTYILTFLTIDGGTTWLGMSGGEF